jgi:hypothetical protein
MKNAYTTLGEKPEGKEPLSRPSRTWQDNIKVDLKDTGYEDVDWIDLALNRDQ